MAFPLSAFIAFRYAKAGRATLAGQNSFVSFINRFSVAGIALGLMSLIIVISVMNGFEGQLKQRILGIVPHIIINEPDWTADITVLPGVEADMRYREAEGVVQSKKELRGVQVHGVSPNVMSEHTMVANRLEQGAFSHLTEGSFNAVIGRALAVQLEARMGDKLRLMVTGASVYTPFGRMPSQRLITVAGIFDMGSQVDDKVVYLNRYDVNRLLRDPKGSGESRRLFLSDAFNYQDTLSVLNESGASTNTWRERQGPLFDAVKMEKNMMFLMLLLIIAVAAFNIVSALVMVVSEKQGDIAVLQTQGMVPAAIMWIFVLNGLFNGLKGALIGLVTGLFVAYFLNDMLAFFNAPISLSADGRGLPIEIDLLQIMLVALLSLLLCVLASVYPAMRAMRIQPSMALQNE